jgi:transposase InsO family protein
MPWLETDVHEERIKFVTAARQPGANVRALCRTFQISPPTAYRWLGRYATAGAVRGLVDQSRRPHHSPRQTALVVEEAVVALRRAYGWAGAKLQPLLAAQGHALSPATIDRIIRRRGLTDPDEAHRPAVHRFTRETPNALWQMDFKGQYPLSGGWIFPLSILDDHSRFAVALAPLRGTAAAPVRRVLQRCFHEHGLPEAILVDHGVPWWHATNGHGLTRLTVFLLEQDIAVRYSGIAHPQTQGKVERFHRTLGRRLRQWGVPTTRAAFARALARFLREYNEVRPHAALDQHPPVTRYTPSPRAYTARPRRWDYPADHAVVRVSSRGTIRLRHRTLRLSEALAGRWVGCRVLDDHMLIAFRGSYVRELDLRTGALQPVAPARLKVLRMS